VNNRHPPVRRVRSPCVSVCRMDPATGWCEGCLRTIDEIAAWGSLSEDERRRIWAELGDRRASLGAQPAHSKAG